jgi:hypothetical protein
MNAGSNAWLSDFIRDDPRSVAATLRSLRNLDVKLSSSGVHRFLTGAFREL